MIHKTALPIHNLSMIRCAEPFALITCLSEREYRDGEHRIGKVKSTHKNLVEHRVYNFHDSEPSKIIDGILVKFGSLTFFDKDMAHSLLLFHEELLLRDIKFLYVHCWCGVSRSPAVCAALDKIEGKDDHEWFRYYSPNMHVYRTLLETYHEMVN